LREGERDGCELMMELKEAWEQVGWRELRLVEEEEGKRVDFLGRAAVVTGVWLVSVE
jgi:hypothetical protein